MQYWMVEYIYRQYPYTYKCRFLKEVLHNAEINRWVIVSLYSCVPHTDVIWYKEVGNKHLNVMTYLWTESKYDIATACFPYMNFRKGFPFLSDNNYNEFNYCNDPLIVHFGITRQYMLNNSIIIMPYFMLTHF
jgi:uncharacterized membrane protein YjdF